MDFKLPIRTANSNKGTYGKVLNIAGSKYMTGAAYISSIAALRSGCGYVQLLSEDIVIQTVAQMAPEIIYAPIDKLEETIKTADVLSIGCGLSGIIKPSLDISVRKYFVFSSNLSRNSVD